MRSWMIRHPNMTFTKPIPEADLIQLIESGDVTAQDEIAPNTGYWFSIQEVEEVKRHFGDKIILQALMPSGADTTSSTNTALIGRSQKVKSGKIAKAKVALATPKPVTVPVHSGANVQAEEEVSYTAPRFVFGLLLTAVFLGTLCLLWLGSR